VATWQQQPLPTHTHTRARAHTFFCCLLSSHRSCSLFLYYCCLRNCNISLYGIPWIALFKNSNARDVNFSVSSNSLCKCKARRLKNVNKKDGRLLGYNTLMKEAVRSGTLSDYTCCIPEDSQLSSLWEPQISSPMWTTFTHAYLHTHTDIQFWNKMQFRMSWAVFLVWRTVERFFRSTDRLW
jgi:hypothetical protein